MGLFVGDPATPVQPHDGSPLILRLEQTPTTRPGGLSVRVTIENAGQTPALIAPLFFPADARGKLTRSPENLLVFDVRDSAGRPAKLAASPGRWNQFDPVWTTERDLLELEPGRFYGANIDLEAGLFAHRMPARGEYRIRAVFTSNARDWLRRLEELRRRKLPGAELARIFQGQLESNEIVARY